MTISAAAVSTPAAAEHPARPVLLIAALGVVFGDIGTSPIYAFRESLRAAGDVEAQATILGILSLVFWAVVLVVALKYVVFVMRADNHGEGGTTRPGDASAPQGASSRIFSAIADPMASAPYNVFSSSCSTTSAARPVSSRFTSGGGAGEWSDMERTFDVCGEDMAFPCVTAAPAGRRPART